MDATHRPGIQAFFPPAHRPRIRSARGVRLEATLDARAAELTQYG